MADDIGKENKTSSYNAAFSGTPKQLEHQKAMAHEDHSFQLQLQKGQHDHECRMKNKELGWIGVILGASENSSKNISALICVILLLAIIAMSCWMYKIDGDKDFIGKLWQMILPVITLSLGYIFGKKE